MKKIGFLILTVTLLIGCSNDDDNDNAPINISVLFNFSQNWDGITVSSADFGTTDYITDFGHEINILRIRYLISRLVLTNSDGVAYPVGDYNLIDMDDPSTFTFDPNVMVPEGNYTLSFVYGFNQADNTDNAYNDLNTASWNWPQMLGGGYHFMQFDGMYDVNTTIPMPFNYHNGTAKVSDGVFEQNFVQFNLTNNLLIEAGSVIEINMNIAEWFKNPYSWDLDVYNTPLMPNYDAQKLMQQNAATVFSAVMQ
jgi:hypothetical protein